MAANVVKADKHVLLHRVTAKAVAKDLPLGSAAPYVPCRAYAPPSGSY
jgi:hypothetical protein